MLKANVANWFTMVLTISLLLLSACPRNDSGSQESASEPAVAGTVETTDSADSATQGSPADAAEVTWRAFIDPGLSLEEIAKLSQSDARARLQELNVPFEPANYSETIEMDPPELTALFIQAGMPVDTPNHAGVSALQAAAALQKPKHVRVLLKYGADLNYRDTNFNATAVDFAINGGNLGILQQLLDAGGDIAGSPESRPNLLDAISSGNPEMFQYIYEKFPDVSVVDAVGQNSLIIACLGGNLEIVRSLVSAGVDLNYVEPQGGTAIAAAAFNGNWEVLRYLIELGVDPLQVHRGNINMLYEFAGNLDYPQNLAEELVNRGMDVNLVSEGAGQTPLMFAVNNGNLRLAEFLLERGADHEIRDIAGYTACDYANLSQYGEMVQLFARYGISSNVQAEVPEVQ